MLPLRSSGARYKLATHTPSRERTTLLEAARKKTHVNLGRIRCLELSEYGAGEALKIGQAVDFARDGSSVLPDLPLCARYTCVEGRYPDVMAKSWILFNKSLRLARCFSSKLARCLISRIGSIAVSESVKAMRNPRIWCKCSRQSALVLENHALALKCGSEHVLKWDSSVPTCGRDRTASFAILHLSRSLVLKSKN